MELPECANCKRALYQLMGERKVLSALYPLFTIVVDKDSSDDELHYELCSIKCAATCLESLAAQYPDWNENESRLVASWAHRDTAEPPQN